MRERGVEPVDTPDMRDVNVEEGQALTFTASFDTVPAFEPGDYSTPLAAPAVDARSTTRRSTRRCSGCASAPRGSSRSRAAASSTATPSPLDLDRAGSATGKTDDVTTDVGIELGAKANPPGFDAQLLGLEVGAAKSFTIHYPGRLPDRGAAEHGRRRTRSPSRASSAACSPSSTTSSRRISGSSRTLEALRARVREDLEHEARHAAERDVRADSDEAAAARVPFELPASLIEREIDRRLEDFARRLMDQNIDPRQAGIDWKAFRESQREPAREAVAGAHRAGRGRAARAARGDRGRGRAEIARYAERTGRTPAAVRARARKGGRLVARLRGSAPGEVN